MGIYVLQDLETTDDGDLVVNDFGDLKVASPLRTVAQAIDWIILTNKGELLAEPTFGANIQSFYGDDNSVKTHGLMQSNIIQEMKDQGLLLMTDVEVDVVPIETDEAAILVDVKGDFLDTETTTGAYERFIDEFSGLTRGYVYPFTSGVITPLSE